MNVFRFFILFLLAACSPSNSESTEGKETTIANLPEDILQVEVKKVERKNFSYTLQSNAKTEAASQAAVQFRVGGYVQSVLVQNGQYVQTGQIIAILDKTEALLSLQKAHNQKAIAHEEYIKEVLDYGGNLQSEHGGVAQELNERILVRKGVRSAELQIKEAELQLRYTHVTAPFAGRIADCTLKAGNFITPQQQVCTLYSSLQLQATAEILETEASTLKIGQIAQVVPLACQDKTCEVNAKIIEINPKVGTNGLFRVKLSLEKSNNIFLGTNLQVRIIVPQRQTLVVPKNAIIVRSGKKVVFSVENNLAKWHYVTTGLENDQEVEILEGLKENEQIVVSNNIQLNHDSPVRTKK